MGSRDHFDPCSKSSASRSDCLSASSLVNTQKAIYWTLYASRAPRLTDHTRLDG
jgi:hypothetical protein